jgi:hypothetical protein
MGSWRDDANHCRDSCTHSHLMCRRVRLMSALLLCADFARTDSVSALCPNFENRCAEKAREEVTSLLRQLNLRRGQPVRAVQQRSTSCSKPTTSSEHGILR